MPLVDADWVRWLFVVPPNALLLVRAKSVGRGNATAVQTLTENSAMLPDAGHLIAGGNGSILVASSLALAWCVLFALNGAVDSGSVVINYTLTPVFNHVIYGAG